LQKALSLLVLPESASAKQKLLTLKHIFNRHSTGAPVPTWLALLPTNLELGLPLKVFLASFSSWKSSNQISTSILDQTRKTTWSCIRGDLGLFWFTNKAFPIIWMPFISLRALHTKSVALIRSLITLSKAEILSAILSQDQVPQSRNRPTLILPWSIQFTIQTNPTS